MNGDKPHFERIGQRLIHRDVLSALRAAILDGTLQPGERIVEADIAEQMDISRGPVREALAELEEEGLVVRRAYKGTFVATYSARHVRELYSLRALLEGYAARLAAVRVQPEDIEKLESLVNSMKEAGDAGDIDTLVEKDIQFHREICRLSDHDLLIQMWNKLVSRTRLFLTLANLVYFTHDHMVGTHYPTLEALRNADPDLAEKTIKEPMIKGGEVMARGMEEETDGRMRKDRVTELWEQALTSY